MTQTAILINTNHDDDEVIVISFSVLRDETKVSSRRSCLGKDTWKVLGYAAWDGSPMQTNTIPRYPGLVAHESAQANAVEGHENAK